MYKAKVDIGIITSTEGIQELGLLDDIKAKIQDSETLIIINQGSLVPDGVISELESIDGEILEAI